MKSIHNLTIIGTSHIAEESVKEILKTIKNEKPDIIAVELDKNRLTSLTSKKKSHLSIKSIKQIGVSGFLFAAFAGMVQKKLGKVVRIQPGEDMLTAIKEAEKQKAKIALIDQNIAITLKKISRALGFKTYLRMFGDFVRSFIFPKREMKRYGLNQINLKKVPTKKVINHMMKEFEKRYPKLFYALVAERNIIMSRRLSKLMMENPDKKIIAVVGAGHEDEIHRMIEENTRITYTFNIS